ncbi:hypothetical protein HPB49_020004 [Dermacentor silvarum]|uniref:Uncharacterized protein n=1 Tax=Dermacentor silvarum TaxID=543639 RepID=A0ACB8D7T1_DERSI|nr:hypothetical protein HPB49_020004 [Dermacentor silvarum]
MVVHGDEQNVTYEELATFVDTFGARPSGSKSLEDSIDYMLDVLRMAWTRLCARGEGWGNKLAEGSRGSVDDGAQDEENGHSGLGKQCAHAGRWHHGTRAGRWILQRTREEVKAGIEPVVKLVMRAKLLPPAVSRNTIAEIRGKSKPEEVVLLSGHLDSWDVGQGAMDDGAGAFISWRALAVLRRLGLKPRRTLRCVLWTGEEQGITGALDYFRRHFAREHHLMNLVMESDSGTFRPLGLGFSGSNGRARCIVAEVLRLFASINATQLALRASEADVSPWNEKGVPALSLSTANDKYFYFHHTEADTMSVLDRHELDLCTALWAAASYVFADLTIRLPR